jgi:hypothetical protein
MGMTNSELHLHFLTKAETAEARALRRKQQIKESCTRDLHMKWQSNKAFYASRNFEHELEHKVGSACKEDPLWKTAVADNQWFMHKAVMYGTAANNELLAALLQVMTSGKAT